MAPGSWDGIIEEGFVTFEELFAKLDQAQLTANHYKLITAAVLGDMLEFFDYFIIGFILSFIIVPWKLTFGATAIVLLSAGVGSLVGSFFFGWLADRIGRMPVLYITTAMFAIPSGIMYFTPEGNWIFLTVFRLLVGFGVGGLYSVDLPLVQEFVPTRMRGMVGGIVTALIPAGVLLGSASAAFLTPLIGWRGLFLIGLIPGSIALMFRFWMRESPRWLVKQGRYEEAVKSINWVSGFNIDYRTMVIKPEDRSAAAVRKPSLMEIFKYPRSVLVTWITSFLQSIMDYGFVLWAPTLLAMVLQIPPTRAAKLFIVVAFGSVIAKCIWAVLSELIGRRLGGIMIGLGSALMCLIVSQFWSAHIGTVPVIFISFIAVYGFINGGWSITGPYSAEIWPQRLRATGMGSAYGIGGVGRIFGPVILAFFAGSSNLVLPKATTTAITPAYIFFACCGLAMAVTYSFARETRNKSVAEIEAMLSAENKAASGAAAGR
jgi:putative MFS transporter